MNLKGVLMDKNEIKELCEIYLDGIDSVLEEIVELAKKDSHEYKNLIDLFDSEKDLDKKLILSDILVDLNYSPVKNNTPCRFFLN